MDTPYGKFIYESFGSRDFTVYVTIPDGKVKVNEWNGKNALREGMRFFRKCIGVETAADVAEEALESAFPIIESNAPPKPKCDHIIGKFIGHTLSPNYENHECAKCGEIVSIRINR